MALNPLMRNEMMGNWYLASLIKRYHTWPTIRTETVGEHSHGVAMIYLRLFDPMDTNESDEDTLKAVRWILENDLAELWSGDAPFPVKLRYPSMRDAHHEVERDANVALGVRVPLLSEQTIRRIKACDMLQMYLFGLHEVRMGNTYSLPIVRDALTSAMMSMAGDEYAIGQIRKFAEEHHE